MERTNKSWQLENINARIDQIHVNGLQRTKDDYVVGAFDQLFKITTFEELLERTIETRMKLENLGCFKSVNIVIDTSKGPKATSGVGYDLTFNVIELGKWSGRFDTVIENNKPAFGFVVQTPNLCGRGEQIRSDIKYASKSMQNFNTSFIKPLKVADGSLSSTVFKQATENNASGYKLNEYGALLGVSFVYADRIDHKVEYEGTIRNTGVLNRDVAFSVREASGYSLKSSLRNTLGADSRDSVVFPTRGHLVKLTTEFAGLGGDIGFLKNELFSQINVPILSDVSLQGSFGAGVLTSTTKDKYYSLIDRFFLGGPLTLRGFPFNGIGPKADSCCTGGSTYWIGALHLYTPLPHRPKRGTFGDNFRIHLFCNAGNLTHVADTIERTYENLSKGIRLAYGIGLVYRFGQMARIELNYCVPLLYQADDKLMGRIQFGIGVQFV